MSKVETNTSLKVGFTGTRLGMNTLQVEAFHNFLIYNMPPEFHHGDCIGADADAHEIVHSLKITIIIHPPIDNKLRANCKTDFYNYRSKKDYLSRNKDIVDETDILIAVPEGRNELVRSGTWSTVRYARKQSKLIYIIFFDGEVKEEV